MPGRPELRLSLPEPPATVPSKSNSWKSTRLGDSMEGRVPTNIQVYRWDGAARSCVGWDNLRRDPELWYRGGNCFVHLYGKGQSRRGPAFKVPFGALLAAQCHPLIHRFAARDLPESPGGTIDPFDDLEQWNQLNPTRRIDLFIPAPRTADKQEAFLYHLATRNLFAWIFRRSLVGATLGSALIGVLNSMSEFRNHDEDHASDLLDYLDEEGYLDIRSHPVHALAILRLAELFRLRDLYVHAFCHCVGMSERLYSTPEYEYTSAISKKLIRRGRVEMDLRLGKASVMLTTFLEDDLSETHLGLPSAARAHLERFRSFLFSFYTNRLGYFPPASIDSRSTIFEPEIYSVMRDDFEALLNLLVDESFTSAGTTPLLAQGGICTIQSVHGFDSRCGYESLDHPLPLLPELPIAPATKRLSWLSRGSRTKPDHRLVSHAALVKASNHQKPGVLRNDLVKAFQRFETTNLLDTSKIDRGEKISLVDARKVQWILVYALTQVLRSCTRIPDEVSGRDVEYNLTASVNNLPPWKEGEGFNTLSGCQTVTANIHSPAPSPAATEPGMSLPISPTSPTTIEIKPDIDYFALTHREERDPRRTRSMRAGPPRVPSRTRSLGKSLSRNSTIRRSMSLFRGLSVTAEDAEGDWSGQQSERQQQEQQASPARRSSYYEIVVRGYGNGTNAVSMTTGPDESLSPEPQYSAAVGTNRTPSTSSHSSAKSSINSNGSTADTTDSSAPSASPKTPTHMWPMSSPSNKTAPTDDVSVPVLSSPNSIRGRREVVSMITPTWRDSDIDFSSDPRRAKSIASNFCSSSFTSSSGDGYAHGYETLMQEEHARAEFCPSPIAIRRSFKDPFAAPGTRAAPTQDCNDPAAWQPYNGGSTSPLWNGEDESADDDVKPVWEQFSDLGGLTCLDPVPAAVAAPSVAAIRA